MKKTYFIVLRRNKGGNGVLEWKSFFYHKRFFETRREMIEFLYKDYPEWSFESISRVY